MLPDNHTDHKDIFSHGGLTADVSRDLHTVYDVYHSQCRYISDSYVLTSHVCCDEPSVLPDNHIDHKDISYHCGLTPDVS